jgi:hypothetical protein
MIRILVGNDFSGDVRTCQNPLLPPSRLQLPVWVQPLPTPSLGAAFPKSCRCGPNPLSPGLPVNSTSPTR